MKNVNKFNNNKGAGLALVIFLMFGLSALTVHMLSRQKQQKALAARQAADNDAEAVFAQIATIFQSAADCNANFWVSNSASFLSNGGATAPGTATLSAIKVCTSTHTGSGCKPGVAVNNTQNLMVASSTTWDRATLFPQDPPTATPRRVRVREIRYRTVNSGTADHDNSTFNNNNPQAIITVRLEKNYDPSYHPTNPKGTSFIERTFKAYVLVNASNRIRGCTRNWQSQVVYPDTSL